MTNHCGTCTACCREFAIPELDKPAGKWCQHCDIGVGCKVYATRPQVCRDFSCLWLQSQDMPKPLPPELRPDRCKVLLSPTTNERVLSATTQPGNATAWRKGPILDLIKSVAARGINVVIGPPSATRKTMVTRKGDKLVEREVRMTPPDSTGMQWSVPEPKEQP